jgi:hypothetical protein
VWSQDDHDTLLGETTSDEHRTKADPTSLAHTYPPIIPNAARIAITDSIMMDMPYSDCINNYLCRRDAELRCRQVQPC